MSESNSATIRPNTITHSRFFHNKNSNTDGPRKLNLHLTISDPTQFNAPTMLVKKSATPSVDRKPNPERTFLFPSVVVTDANRRQTVSAFSDPESRKNSVLVSRMSNMRTPKLHKDATIEDAILQKELRNKTLEALKRNSRGSMFCHDLWDRTFYLNILKASGINKVLKTIRKSKWMPLEYLIQH